MSAPCWSAHGLVESQLHPFAESSDKRHFVKKVFNLVFSKIGKRNACVFRKKAMKAEKAYILLKPSQSAAARFAVKDALRELSKTGKFT